MAQQDVKLTISAETKSLTDGLAKATDQIRNFGSQVQGAMGGAGGALGGFSSMLTGGLVGAIAGATAAAVGAGAAFVALGVKGLETADKLNKMSEKTALSVEFLSALKMATDDADVSLDVIGKSFKSFSVKLIELKDGNKEAENSFRKLGLSAKDFANLGNEDGFKLVLSRLEGITDGALKTATAVDLFSKAGVDMIAVLKSTGGDLDAFIEKARKAGLVYDAESARNASAYNDTMKRLGTTLEAFAFQVIQPALGPLKKFAEWMGEVTAEARGGYAILKQWLDLPWSERLTLGTFDEGVAKLNAMAKVQELLRRNAERDEKDQAAKKQAAEEKKRADDEKKEKARVDAQKRFQDALAKLRKSLQDEEKKYDEEQKKQFTDRLKREGEQIKKGLDQEHKIALENLKTTREMLVAELDGQVKNLQQARQQGLITEREYLTALKSIEADKSAAYIAEVQARLAMSLNDPVETAKLENDLKRLQQARDIVQSNLTNQLDTLPGGDAGAGRLQGLRDYLQQAGDLYTQWRDAVVSTLQGVENAFAQGLQGMLSGQMSFAQGIRSIWKGIVGSVIQAVSQLIAKWIVMAVVKKALGIQEAATDGGRTAASLTAATAETWAAYAGIPFVGPALAMAQIATMYASMGASIGAAQGIGAGVQATARAVGGLVSRPELTLLGEAGPEVVAPERDFKDWAAGFAGMGAAVAMNLSAGYSAIRGYDSAGAGFASAAQATGNVGGRGASFDLRGAMFLGSEAETRRMLGDLVYEVTQDRDRRNA